MSAKKNDGNKLAGAAGATIEGGISMTASNDAELSDTVMNYKSVGEWLRAARESSGQSTGDIAAKLRMGQKQVIALEASEFAALPTGTFLRGFVRNYAKAVSLKPESVLALLESTHQSAAPVSATPVVMPLQQNIRVPSPRGEIPSGFRSRIFFFLLGFLVLGACAYYWWNFIKPFRQDGGRLQEAAIETIAPQVVANPMEGKSLPPSIPVQAGESPIAVPSIPDENAMRSEPSPKMVEVKPPAEPIKTASTVDAEPGKAIENPMNQKPAAGQGALGFTFNGESWVEVTDAKGKIILSRRFKAGDAEQVVGKMPLSIIVGNAQSTRLAFNGKEYDLAPHTRISVARLTLR